MIEATAAITLIISFSLTYYILPVFIRKLQDNGYVVKDMYKRFKEDVPTKGGIAVIFAVYLTIVIVPAFFRILNTINSAVEVPEALSQKDDAMLLVIVMFALYGIVDDLIDIGRPAKILLPIVFSYPLLVVITPTNIDIPLYGELIVADTIVNVPLIGDITYYRLIRFLIMPVYIMVVANLINMHSCFNGLQSGISTIVLATLLIKMIIVENGSSIITVGAVTGALAAFWFFNRYPSRIFEGNIGALAVGAAIGSAILVNDFLISGLIILIPHIFNFLLYVYWRIMNYRNPEDKKFRMAKFGTLLADGNLEVPNPYTLKWILPFYFRVNEKQATYAMYGITIFFCAIALFIPS